MTKSVLELGDDAVGLVAEMLQQRYDGLGMNGASQQEMLTMARLAEQLAECPDVRMSDDLQEWALGVIDEAESGVGAD